MEQRRDGEPLPPLPVFLNVGRSPGEQSPRGPGLCAFPDPTPQPSGIRSGYASVMADILTNHLETGTTTGKVVYDLKKDGTVVAGTENTFGGDFVTQGKATDQNKQDIAGQEKTWSDKKHVQYIYTPSADDGTTN